MGRLRYLEGRSQVLHVDSGVHHYSAAGALQQPRSSHVCQAACHRAPPVLADRSQVNKEQLGVRCSQELMALPSEHLVKLDACAEAVRELLQSVRDWGYHELSSQSDDRHTRASLGLDALALLPVPRRPAAAREQPTWSGGAQQAVRLQGGSPVVQHPG